MIPADFKRLALSLEGAEEGSHMGSVDFRVGGRIFATLAAVKLGYGNLMLTPAMQHDLVTEMSEVFLPVHGGWGESGATHMRLAQANEDVALGALRMAWKLRLDKNSAARPKLKRSAKPKPAAATKPKPAPKAKSASTLKPAPQAKPKPAATTKPKSAPKTKPVKPGAARRSHPPK